MTGEVLLRREGAVAHVTFARPEAMNAMTWAMYDRLDAICAELSADPTLRCVVFRGAGGRAFVAGSDIGQFAAFEDGEDGIAYEAAMDAHLAAIEAIPCPTLCVIDRIAVGGGLAIAAACDLRIASDDARLGIPIARTLGNCLSMANYARVVSGFGVARAKRMLMLGELLTAQEAREAGFLTRVVPTEALDAEAAAITARLLANAPVTMAVTKAALARLATGDPGDGADLIRRTYASADFRRGVTAFVAKEKPQWQGD